MHSTVNSKSNLTLFTSLGCIYIREQMTGETSGPSAQDIRMASFEEKFNDLLNFVRLLVKRDTESEKQVEDINKDTSEDNTGGHSHTNLGPPPLIPTSHPRTIHLQKGIGIPLKALSLYIMYGNGEENVMNKKEDDHSDIRSLQGQPLYPSNQGDTIEPHSDVDGHSSKGSKESEKEAQSPISKKEEPKEVDHPMIPHKRTGKYEVTKQKGNEKDTEGKETLMLHTGAIPIRSKSFFRRKTKVRISRKFCTLPMPMDELLPKVVGEKEDCHALKNKVQDLVDHGILRINEGSTPSVIIAWPPEHCKDETVIPSPQSQRPTTCGIQPVHLTMLPTLSEPDKEKAEYRASRCMTLKRKIQGLGHSEPDVPFMVQARKPSMHTVPMKKARSTLGFGANGPSRDQTERTIPRSTGAWIPHRQG
uniref:Uncharacterized protein n=1 Tax=Fagus sylvatica TaxID=28930 RepID=A0A2N9HEE8_FAGSY